MDELPHRLTTASLLLIAACISVSLCQSLTAQQTGQVPFAKNAKPPQANTADAREKLPNKAAEQDLKKLRERLQLNAGLRELLAREAEKSGNAELAAWFRANLPVNDGQASLASATVFAEKGDWSSAADAYLAACKVNPDLLKEVQLAVFQKTGRMSELANCFDDEALSHMSPLNTSPVALVGALLRVPSSKPQGYKLLQRVFNQGSNRHRLLINPPSSLKWREVPDPLFYLRAAFIPKDFDKEGAGWGRLAVQSSNNDQAIVYGLLTSMQPLYHDRGALRQLAEEIRGLLKNNRRWVGGWALLAFVEAEIGNYDETAQLLSARFVETNSDRIPSHSAWMLGVCLAGKDQKLDQVVIQLLEPALKKIAEKSFTRPPGTYGPLGNEPLRVSPLSRLAKLYAKYDRRLEARQLLYGLVDSAKRHPLVQDYEPSDFIYCGYKARCAACHSEPMNYYDFIVMSDTMTQIGYPVDSLISLARVDASFGHAFSSARGWIDTSTEEGKALEGTTQDLLEFTAQHTRAAKAVTPRLVMEALDLDTFQRSRRSDQKKFRTVLEQITSIKGDAGNIIDMRELADEALGVDRENVVLDLMLSVRGEGKNSEATVFSPVVDILELAANMQAPQANQDIAELDAKLLALRKQHPENTEVAIAATVFAFLRNDFDAAEERLEKLQASLPPASTKLVPNDLGLWLVARYALAADRTRARGEQLASRASAAAAQHPDPLWKKAIGRERKEMLPPGTPAPSNR